MQSSKWNGSGKINSNQNMEKKRNKCTKRMGRLQ